MVRVQHKRTAIAVGIVFIAALALTNSGSATITLLQESPRKSAELVLKGKKISLDYGAPSVRGRKIMGGLVPYGQVWRLGANEATGFKTEANLVIRGLNVPAGSYTLFAVPAATGWKLIINKTTGQWGTPYTYEKTELGRIDMRVTQLKSPVEQMVIKLEKAGTGAVLAVEWEGTRASVNFAVKK
jgi:hypothetical protein